MHPVAQKSQELSLYFGAHGGSRSPGWQVGMLGTNTPWRRAALQIHQGVDLNIQYTIAHAPPPDSVFIVPGQNSGISIFKVPHMMFMCVQGKDLLLWMGKFSVQNRGIGHGQRWGQGLSLSPLHSAGPHTINVSLWKLKSSSAQGGKSHSDLQVF